LIFDLTGHCWWPWEKFYYMFPKIFLVYFIGKREFLGGVVSLGNKYFNSSLKRELFGGTGDGDCFTYIN
jgi:hypothetical protein